MYAQKKPLGGGYGGQGGLFFFVGALPSNSHMQLKFEMSNSPKVYAWQKDDVLNTAVFFFQRLWKLLIQGVSFWNGIGSDG